MDIRIGDYYEKEFFISEDEGKKFAEISGDFNPLHLDDNKASESIFGKKIVHGMLVASYISSILGTQFPGEGTIYLKQDIKFIKPVFYNSRIIIRIEVKDIIMDKNRILLSTDVINEKSELLISGEALVKKEGI